MRAVDPATPERRHLEEETVALGADVDRRAAGGASGIPARLERARLLRTLADHDGDPHRIEQAIQDYRESLEETSPDDGNLLWRKTNAELGGALLELHRITGEVEPARRAIRPLRNAMPLHAPDSRAFRILSRQVGQALRAVGDAEADVNSLRQAVSAFRAGLAPEGLVDGDDPTERARAVRELAGALRVLGGLAGESDRLAEAYTLLEEALGWIGNGEPFTRTLLLAEIQRVRESLGRSAPRSSAAREALRAYAEGEGGALVALR